ncbi:MAG: hypothetical protein IIU81_00995 [Peptococcaceae bacterium]|nr:hypothetical protein [Peptococcaceae bacterium]
MKHGNKLIALLVLILFCMMSFLPSAAWATNQPVDVDKLTDEEIAEKIDAQRENLIDTGINPLLTIQNIEAPDKVAVGQEFEIQVTVKNMGTGPAMNTKFKFTEDKERKALSNFSVVGGDGDTYDTMVTEIKGGETKIFSIALKVNENTRELPAGSKYRINCTLECSNWNSIDNYTTATSFELEVSYALSEPNFVVENVTFNPAVTEGVTETTATIHLKNISDAKANNVVTTLSGTEIGSTGSKNISVRDLTNTKQLYTVNGQQKVAVEYQLSLNKDRKNNEMLFTITYNGQERPQEVLLNMPLPLNESVNGREPKVIIKQYKVNPTKVLAGNNVTLSLYIENTNSLPVNNVSIQLDVPTETSSAGGSVSGGTVFSPVNSSNTFYLDRIEGKEVAVKNINMYVDPNASAKTYIVPVNISYEGTDGTKYTAGDNVNIPVGQESKVDIISTNVQSSGNVGEPLSIAMEFVNIGKVNLTNFKVSLDGDIPGKGENVYYIGNFNVGDTDEYSAMIYPENEGILAGNIRISYIDGDNQEVIIDEPFSSEIGPAIDYSAMMEPVMPMPEPEPTFAEKLKSNLLTIIIGIVAIAEGAILFKSKRKEKAEEELIDG